MLTIKPGLLGTLVLLPGKIHCDIVQFYHLTSLSKQKKDTKLMQIALINERIKVISYFFNLVGSQQQGFKVFYKALVFEPEQAVFISAAGMNVSHCNGPSSLAVGE